MFERSFQLKKVRGGYPRFHYLKTDQSEYPDQNITKMGFVVKAGVFLYGFFNRVARTLRFQVPLGTTVENGVHLLRLETGIHQHHAIALYESWGFQKISAFGEYKQDPLSLFYEKAIP